MIGRNDAVSARDDRGSTIPLIAVFAALALAIVIAVTAATSLYIERKRLLTIADGASLAAAESYRLDDIALDSDGVPTVRLQDAAVADVVDDYVASVPADGLDGLVVEAADAPDGESARVELSARWAPPVVSLFLPSGFRVRVTSTARSVLR